VELSALLVRFRRDAPALQTTPLIRHDDARGTSWLQGQPPSCPQLDAYHCSIYTVASIIWLDYKKERLSSIPISSIPISSIPIGQSTATASVSMVG
jgi:hypothetical protein